MTTLSEAERLIISLPLTEHRIPGHSVWQFDVIDNALTDIRALF